MVRRRVLVVVDDPKTRAMVALHLQRDGFEVLVAEDGVTALQIARDRKIDAGVLDLMLPRSIATVFGIGYEFDKQPM